MNERILVLHGPNVAARLEALGDPRASSVEALSAVLSQAARPHGAELKIIHASNEGDLADALFAERGWAQGALLSVGALALTSEVLREAVELFPHPVVEVHPNPVPAAGEGEGGSLLAAVCDAREVGHGVDSFLAGLERVVHGRWSAEGARGEGEEVTVRSRAPAPRGKTLGRTRSASGAGAGHAASGPPGAEETSRPAKTLGRASPLQAASGSSFRPEKTLGRSEVGAAQPLQSLVLQELRQKLSERLGGVLSGAELAAWAKERWNTLQGPGTADPDRARAEELLLHLAAAGARLGDHQLLELTARLDG